MSVTERVSVLPLLSYPFVCTRAHLTEQVPGQVLSSLVCYTYAT